MNKVNITFFSGGSGNKEILELLNKNKNLNINVITNCYDDGKSTGRLRYLIPGMLGPSDIRKNISNLLDSDNENQNLLKNIIEFRFKKIKFNKNIFKELLKNIFFKNLINQVPIKTYNQIIYYMNIASKFFAKYNKYENDISFGNILFAGIYLKEKKFNSSIEIFNKIFLEKIQVYNVTNGQNLFLYALRENGEILSEGEMVENKGEKIKDIFLMSKKINIKLTEESDLLKKQIFPKINNTIIKLIERSDLIIYGPGTQYSSLFPSYLTKQLYKTVSKSKAKKVFVSNIFFDNDIYNESVNSIIKKYYFYFSQKRKIKINKTKLVDQFFVNKYDEDDVNNLNKKNYLKILGNLSDLNITFIDWEKQNGKHYPGILIKESFKLLKNKNIKTANNLYTISILIPAFNEEKKIEKVLKNLKNLNLEKYHLSKEILVIDGNSSDRTMDIIKKFDFCKIYKMSESGKGLALKYGIKKAKGDLICFFPADGEYDVEDIKKVIEPILYSNSQVVFGSRLIKCLDLSAQIKKIYKNNYFSYLVSKYGGILLSTFLLLFYNRYISDPLTSIKAFKADTIKKYNLNSKSFDLEIELIVKILNNKKYILEIPVKYFPRFKSEGKKITILDGLKCLVKIIFYKFK